MENLMYGTVIHPYSEELSSKSLSRCLKLRIVPNPRYTMFVPICAYFFTEGKHFTTSLWIIQIASITTLRLLGLLFSKIRVTWTTSTAIPQQLLWLLSDYQPGRYTRQWDDSYSRQDKTGQCEFYQATQMVFNLKLTNCFFLEFSV